MSIKPKDYLLAKVAVDYFVIVGGLKLSEEHYKFHVYSLAELMSVDPPEGKDEDDFVENMDAFKNRYWSMMDEIYKKSSRSSGKSKKF